MVDINQIKEHMEILGSDRKHVGTVDHIDGQRLKLTKSDPAAGGEHHFIHIDSVQNIDGGKIILNRTTAEARDEWGIEAVK